MKTRHHLPLLATLAFAHTATAQEITKANNTDALNTTSSWVGGSVPGTSNVAVWDATVTAANTTNLGGATSWQGIRIANPGGLVTINHSAATTLTLSSSGIDMASATQDLTVGSNVTMIVGANQTWNVASGRNLLASNITFNSGTTLTLNGGGIVGAGSPGGSGNLTIDGPWF